MPWSIASRVRRGSASTARRRRSAGFRSRRRISEGIACRGGLGGRARSPRKRGCTDECWLGDDAVSSRRFCVAAFGDAGHAFPAIALARALRRRGHEVLVETWGRWREAIDGEGLRFTAAEEYKTFPPPEPGSEGV